jgi:glycine/D-amino acid oxidase-like deaminating enzyme
VWHASGAQHADVPALVQEIAAELRGLSRVQEGARVLEIDTSARGVAVRLSTGEELRVDRVVLAPGPWLHHAPFAGFVPVGTARVKKVVAMHLAVAPRANDPAVALHDEDAFLLPLWWRGHWLFSYTCDEWDVNPEHLSDGLTARQVAEARRVLERYAPDAVIGCTSGRVFCDAYSASGEPVVCAVGDDGRVVFAGAANGCGYRLAPAIAAETVELLTEAVAVGGRNGTG